MERYYRLVIEIDLVRQIEITQEVAHHLLQQGIEPALQFVQEQENLLLIWGLTQKGVAHE